MLNRDRPSVERVDVRRQVSGRFCGGRSRPCRLGRRRSLLCGCGTSERYSADECGDACEWRCSHVVGTAMSTLNVILMPGPALIMPSIAFGGAMP